MSAGARWVRRRAAVLVALVAVCVGLTACSTTETPSQSTVAIVGDATSTSTAGPAWPQILQADDGVRSTVDAVAGSGYLTASPHAVSDRVEKLSAATIVIALGASDVSQASSDETLSAAVTQAVGAASATGARVIVLSPLIPGGGGRQADVISLAARAAGAEYVDVALPPDPSFAGADGALSMAGNQFVAAALAPVFGATASDQSSSESR